MRFYLVCPFFIVAISSWGQTAQEILDHYFKASSNGDITQWDKVKTLYSTSIGYFKTSQKDVSYHRTYTRWPDEQKDELFEDSLFKNHSSSFYFLKDRTIIMLGYIDPVEKIGRRKDSALDFDPVWINKYMQKSKSITYNGIKAVPGKSEPSYEIEIKTPDENLILFFNMETYLLDATYNPKTNLYVTRSNYKLFEKYLLPTHKVSILKGAATGSTTHYKTFEFNPNFDEHLFDPQQEKKYWPKTVYPHTTLKVEESNLIDFVKTNFARKRVFVDMWATWCGPCRFEFTSYDSAYYSMMEKEGISLLYLSVDKDKKKWEEAVEGLGLKGYHAMATRELTESIKESIFDGGKMIIPRYILFDTNGNIISKNFIRPSDPEFKEMLHEALR